MERKKSPNEISLDALIEAAINESENATSDGDVFTSDVVAFMSHYNVKAGSHLINSALLYKIYALWSKQKIKQTQFSIELSLYIPKEKGYYLINKDSSELIADLASVIKKKKPPATRKRANWEHFKAFLNVYSLTEGSEWIEAYIVYHFYDKWIYNKKKKKVLSKINFENFLKAVFETKTTRDGLIVKIQHGFEQTSIDNLREAWKRKQKGPK